MKVYLTEEGKKELEDKIAELKKNREDARHYIDWDECTIKKNIYETILSSAVILPVEESWKDVKDMLDINTLPITYKKGVIIQP